MKRIFPCLTSLILVLACAWNVSAAENDIPDYSDMKNCLKMDISGETAFVEYPFFVVDGYAVEDGKQQGYISITDSSVFTLTNTAPSDKYVMYLTLLPLYPEENNTYTNISFDPMDKMGFNNYFYYTGDGNYLDSLPINPLESDDVLKIRQGESMTFSIPSVVSSFGSTEYFSDDIIWIVAVSTAHGETKTVTEDGSSYTYFSRTEGDTGWVNWWFVKRTTKNPFVDVNEKDYFYYPIKWAIGNSITNGTSDTTFSPNDTCTHAQILTFLWRANGCEEVSGTYDGIDDNAYYANALKWSYEYGLINNKEFDPNAPCTRMDAISYMYLLDYPIDDYSSYAENMTDISASEKQIVGWAIDSAITNGTSETTFSPNNICTRAQIITFLYRAYY